MTAPAGRPALPDDERRDQRIRVGVSLKDLARLARWAEHEGQSITAYVRKRLRLDKEPPKR